VTERRVVKRIAIAVGIATVAGMLGIGSSAVVDAGALQMADATVAPNPAAPGVDMTAEPSTPGDNCPDATDETFLYWLVTTEDEGFVADGEEDVDGDGAWLVEFEAPDDEGDYFFFAGCNEPVPFETNGFGAPAGQEQEIVTTQGYEESFEVAVPAEEPGPGPGTGPGPGPGTGAGATGAVPTPASPTFTG
jgi:hypothetical protein